MRKVYTLFILFALLLSCGPGRDKTGRKAGSALLGEKADDVEVGIDIGQRAPELVFESPDGEKISLTSLRGKMVLIDFWASWCGPCRRENPNLVKVYDKFKDKEFEGGSGFTIYGVSTDRNKEAWVQAIEEDGLVWESQVSDLKGPSVPAAMYGVQAIPMNFLIDGSGIIVAKNLRGEDLETRLRELVK